MPRFVTGTIRSPELVSGTPENPLIYRRTNSDSSTELVRAIEPERKQPLPTFCFYDKSVILEDRHSITDAINGIFDELEIAQNTLVTYGDWHDSNYRDIQGNLVPWRSTEWQLQSRSVNGIIHADQVVSDMLFDPMQVQVPHWEIIVTAQPVTFQGAHSAVGSSQRDLGCCVGLDWARNCSKELRANLIQSFIAHEFGHVLGIPTGKLDQSRLVEIFGTHCNSASCVMKQGFTPQDWLDMTKNRLTKHQIYCNNCKEEFVQKKNPRFRVIRTIRP